MYIELVPGEWAAIDEGIFVLLSSANSYCPSILCVLWYFSNLQKGEYVYIITLRVKW